MTNPKNHQGTHRTHSVMGQPRPRASTGQLRCRLCPTALGDVGMTRILQIVGPALMLVACAAETPSDPPTYTRQTASVPDVPEFWHLDAPLASRDVPQCPPDNVTAEVIAFLKNDVEFTFVVQVDGAGKVREAKLVQARPRGHDLRLLNHAQRCVALITFAEPPHQPYQMNTIVKFSARKRSRPE